MSKTYLFFPLCTVKCKDGLLEVTESKRRYYADPLKASEAAKAIQRAMLEVSATIEAKAEIRTIKRTETALDGEIVE